MKKNRNIALMKRPGFMTPDDESRIFTMGGGELQEMLGAMRPGDRSRVIALLYTQYTARELAELTGRAEDYIRDCGARHRDIQQAARVGRNMALTGLAERKALAVLAAMNPEKIPDDKKARAARDLAEMADLTHKATEAGSGGKGEDTMELVFRVKRRMSARREGGDVGEDGGGRVLDAELKEGMLPP